VGESRSGYGSWRPSIHVYNTCLGLIDATKAATGLGYVVHSHRDKVKESHKKDSYFWCIESGGIRFVAEAVLPFLIVKHRQAEILIEVRKLIEQHVRGHQNDEQIYDLYSEIKILNKTGRKEEEP